MEYVVRCFAPVKVPLCSGIAPARGYSAFLFCRSRCIKMLSHLKIQRIGRI